MSRCDRMKSFLEKVEIQLTLEGQKEIIQVGDREKCANEKFKIFSLRVDAYSETLEEMKYNSVLLVGKYYHLNLKHQAMT